MKKNILKIIFIAIFLTSTFFVSGCSYNEAPNNPNTNYVSFTNYFTIYYNQWTLVEAGHWYVHLEVPAITLNVVKYGAVLVYYKNNENNWVLLPYSTDFYNSQNTLFSEEIWSGFALGTVDIDYIYSDPLNMTPRDILELKIVTLQL